MMPSRQSIALVWILKVIGFTILTASILAFAVAFIQPMVSRLLGIICLIAGSFTFIIILSLSIIIQQLKTIGDKLEERA